MANENGHGGARPGAGRKKKDETNKSNNRVDFTNKQLQELLASPHVAFRPCTDFS